MKTTNNMKRLYQYILELARGGLFHIFGSSILSQILSMVSAILVIRFLPKADYGNYAIAENLYSYLAVFVGLGMSSAILQFCSEKIDDAKKHGIYLYALKKGSVCNAVLMVATLLLALYKRASGDAESGRYLALMCGLPFVAYLNEFVQIVQRVLNDNIIFSRLNIVYSITAVTGNILFTRLWGVDGLIAAIYAANLVVTILGSRNLKRKGFFDSLKYRETLGWDYRKEITKYAVLCAATNFTSTMLVLLDVTCLDMVLENPTVLADYKVASAIPAACMFVPSALITYFYPKIVHNYSAEPDAFYGFIKKMTAMFTAVNGVILVGLLLFAPLIVYIFYGEKYMNVVPIFRMLSLNFFIFGSTRKLFGNVIAAMKKSEVNLVFSLLTGIINIVLNLLILPVYGSIGAAIATVCVSLIIGLASGSYLWKSLVC